MKLAFKATNKDFECHGPTKYELYKIYRKDELPKIQLNTCNNSGFHYCNNIKDVNGYFQLNHVNRVFIIEILGDFKDDRDKSITTAFRFLKEISEEVREKLKELGSVSKLTNEMFLDNFIYPEKECDEHTYKDVLRKEILEEIEKKNKEEQTKLIGKSVKLESDYKSAMNLDLIKQIQIDYPLSIIGGSVALFLYGIRLERWLSYSNSPMSARDIDIILPYYIKLEKLSNGTSVEICEEDTPSMSDFTDRLLIGNTKVDICISPKTKYEYVEYDGFKYKVNTLQEIWEAKIRYGKKKHIQDLKDAMLPKKELPKLTLDNLFDDLPY